jgi:hypothetical protein
MARVLTELAVQDRVLAAQDQTSAPLTACRYAAELSKHRVPLSKFIATVQAAQVVLVDEAARMSILPGDCRDQRLHRTRISKAR